MYVYSLETFVAAEINKAAMEGTAQQKPRLNFASEFVLKIKGGRKEATTRLRGEDDSMSDLDLIQEGSVVSATSFKQPRQFASLKITKIEAMYFDELTDEIA